MFAVGPKTDDRALRNYCCDIRSSENWMTNLAESSEEGCGSKRAVLRITTTTTTMTTTMMMMMRMMMIE
jgi:hypothetical protein